MGVKAVINADTKTKTMGCHWEEHTGHRPVRMAQILGQGVRLPPDTGPQEMDTVVLRS